MQLFYSRGEPKQLYSRLYPPRWHPRIDERTERNLKCTLTGNTMCVRPIREFDSLTFILHLYLTSSTPVRRVTNVNVTGVALAWRACNITYSMS